MRFQVDALPEQSSFGALVTGLDPADLADPAMREALHLREVVSYATRPELAYYHRWQADAASRCPPSRER